MVTIGSPWKHRAILVLFGLALFLPAAYGQLNNLELIESSNSSNGEVEAISGPQVESKNTPAENRPPSARIESPATSVVLRENGSSFEVTFYIPDGFYQSKQQDFFTVTAPNSSPLTVTSVEYPEVLREAGPEDEVKYYDTATLTVQVATK